MKQAVILAGGKGTRLRSRLGDQPKPLVQIGGLPLLERQLRLLERYDFDEALILVNHLAEQIERFCSSRPGSRLRLRVFDDGEPRGTAGATLAVLDELADDALIIYGDTMLEVDLDRFRRYHAADPSTAATLFLHPNDHPGDSDLVEVDDDGWILAFHPYPHDPESDYPNLVNAALYIIRRESIRPWVGRSGVFDFGKNLFPEMLEAGYRLRGYNSPEYIKDCGTPERLDKVEGDLASGKVERSGLGYPQSTVFLDRDGTINHEVDHLSEPGLLKLIDGAPEAIRRLNGSEYRVCIVTNQPVVARGELSFDGLRRIHNRLETLLGHRGAFVDRIFVCPHHPHAGYENERPELKIECECRKPALGMIEQARSELNADVASSWMVGDRTADIELARRAGMRSIAVATGYGARDGRYSVAPDFEVGNLHEAVELILDRFPRLLKISEDLIASLEPGDVLVLHGPRRSGMSSLASAIVSGLRGRGRQAHRFSIDRWAEPLAALEHRDAIAEASALVRSCAGLERGTMRLPWKAHGGSEDAPEVAPGAIIVAEGSMAGELAVEAKMVVRLETDEGSRQARLEATDGGLETPSSVAPGAVGGRRERRLNLDEVFS